jgi:hypothetical protein
MISIQGVRINENSISAYEKNKKAVATDFFSFSVYLISGKELTFRYSSEKERDKVFTNLDTFFKLESCCD